MKVFELMSVLVDIEAGTDIYVSAYPGGTVNVLACVTGEDDMLCLHGDGRYTDDLDDARANTG